MKAEMLRLSEAAYVAGLTVRDVNRSVDEQILPDALYTRNSDGGRLLNRSACPFLTFYFDAASRLTADERSKVISTVWERISSADRNTRGLALVVKDDF